MFSCDIHVTLRYIGLVDAGRLACGVETESFPPLQGVGSRCEEGGREGGEAGDVEKGAVF